MTNDKYRIGLIVNRVKTINHAKTAFDKMAVIVKKYLNILLYSYGFIYDDLIITRSILS